MKVVTTVQALTVEIQAAKQAQKQLDSFQQWGIYMRVI